VRAAIAETRGLRLRLVPRRIRTPQTASRPRGEESQAVEAEDSTPPTQPRELYPFVGGTCEGGPERLPFHLADYLDLVNWTGRAVRDDKRRAIAEDLSPILERIGITRAA